MQEHTVEHLPGHRVEAERHVRHPQRGVHTRMQRLQFANRLDGFDAVPAGFFLPGGNGERQRVDEDVADRHAVVIHEVIDEPIGHPHLPLAGAGLALLVDRQCDDCRPVATHQRHCAGEPGFRTVTVFIID